MGLNAEDKRVYDLLNDKMYIVSPNQRKYVWKSNNWQELLDDLILVYSEKVNNHFIGSVVLMEEDLKDGIKKHFSIIDGQQRISTLTIMLLAIAYLFSENNQRAYFTGLEKALFVRDNKGEEHPIVSEKANACIAKLVISLFKTGRQHFDNGDMLIEANTLAKEIKDPVVRECFLYFYREFKELANADMRILVKYRELIDDIRYIDIVAEESEDAYTIFEILNARGQVLTDFELLRNFLLRYSESKNKTQVEKELQELEGFLGKETESFLKHYVIHKYGKKTDKDDMRPYKVISKEEKSSDVNMIIKDMITKAKYYNMMITFEDCSVLEKKVFSFFKPRRQQMFRPLVLGMMHQRDLGRLSIETYEQYLLFLYEFFICYHIIGEQTSNKINDIVHGYSNKIENNYNDGLLVAFKKSMSERIPSTENISNSIKRIRYSNKWKAYSDGKKRENVRAIFEIVERELGYEGDFENVNIEHCKPDSEREEHAHIGNLMLFEEAINERCKNKPLKEKLQYYQQSNLKYPQIIRSFYNEDDDIDFDKTSNYILDKLLSRIKDLM